MEAGDVFDLVSVFAEKGSTSQFLGRMRGGASALHLACLVGLPSVSSLILSKTIKAEEERRKEGGEAGGWRGRDRKGGSPFYYSAMGNPEQVFIFIFFFFWCDILIFVFLFFLSFSRLLNMEQAIWTS